MSWMTIALIAFIALWAFERNRYRRIAHENRQLIDRVTQLEGAVAPKPVDQGDSDAFDAAELDDLRNRVQVLERIATDENSSEARKAQRIAREIESLRGDIARRSSDASQKGPASKTTEDLSE